jgi:hypothetical protein
MGGQHECCGHHVRIGNLIRFKHEVIHVEYAVAGDPEPDFCYEMVMQVVAIRDGTQSSPDMLLLELMR